MLADHQYAPRLPQVNGRLGVAGSGYVKRERSGVKAKAMPLRWEWGRLKVFLHGQEPLDAYPAAASAIHCLASACCTHRGLRPVSKHGPRSGACMQG